MRSFRLCFKTPDVLDLIEDEVPEEEREAAKAFAEKYVKYGEYITVEFDPEKKTATPLEWKK